MSLFPIFEIAGSAMQAQSERMNVAASNLANADSVAGPDGKPYTAKEVWFQALGKAGQGGVTVAKVVNSTAPFKQVYKPDAPNANAEGYVTMPNVNPVAEMVNMIEASRSYQADVSVMNMDKDLLTQTLSIGSAS